MNYLMHYFKVLEILVKVLVKCLKISSLYFSVLDVVECYIIVMAINISESIKKMF